jgi:sugar phosphate isomerase/epimerase
LENLLGLYSRFFKEPTVEKWRSVVKAGIGEAELSVRFTQCGSAGKYIEIAKEYFKMLTEGGLHVSSIHLPFGPELDVSSPEKGDAVVKDMESILDWAMEKKIGIAVIHPSFEPIDLRDRPARLTKAVESIKTLGDYAETKHIILAVEDLPRTCLGNCAEEMLILTGNGQNASICFDVNHLLLESHKNFFTKTAPYIVTTHFSDYDRIDERHWLVGDGCIDWVELIGLFEKCNYKGRYVFELDETSSPKLGRSFSPIELVERFNNLTCQGTTCGS